MIKQYIKQAFGMLKENPLVNTISILGTALSIAVIMVLVLVFQINNAGYAPETNRDRMLYIPYIRAKSAEREVNTPMSLEVVKECLYRMQTPERVTATSGNLFNVSTVSKPQFRRYPVIYTDRNFWTVFNFNYLYGAPFTDADFESGIPRAVVSDYLAKRLMGKTDIVGEAILVDDKEYIVSGVVSAVSKAADHAYADVWLPYTTNVNLTSVRYTNEEGITGSFSAILLARKASDFESIRQELQNLTAQYNNGKTDYQLDFMQTPLSQSEIARGSTRDKKVPISNYLLTTGSILLFLLLVPALNLIGVIQSSVQKRSMEVGVRKAFGATGKVLMVQVLTENMVITLIGGVIGLILSFLLLVIGKSFLLTGSTLITWDMLIRPGLFLALLVFAFLLNILSAGIPALRMTKQSIVKALKNTENNQ